MPGAAIQVEAHRDGQLLSRHALEAGEYLIGRDPACPICVDSPEVSRKHARLLFDGTRIEIEDVGGRYGTFVNGRQITVRHTLATGQSLSVGRTELRLTLLLQPAPAAMAQPVAAAPAETETVRPTRYETGKIIAQGGMSQVMCAEDHTLRRSVALKVLTPEMAKNSGLVRRFLQEALVLGRLEHPHIIPIYDLGVDAQGRQFYTMKLVRGVTLSEVLDQLRRGRTETVTKYPLAELLGVFQKICDAVAYAHAKGIIHRDLKPANIMLGEYGEVLVMDWGLAKILHPHTVEIALADGTPAGSSGTRYGTIMGTPNYMAPEQADGRLEAMDERTDIFSLGAILYHILTLRPPVTGATEEIVLDKIRAGKIDPPTRYNLPPENASPDTIALMHCPDHQVPKALSAITMQALARQPAKRYQSVADLQRDLGAHQAGFAPTAEHASALRQLRLSLRRHATAAVAASIIALLLIAFGVHSMIKERELRRTIARLHDTAPVYYRTAQTLVAQKKLDEALGSINQAVALQPMAATFQQLKGDIHLVMLQFSKARDAYAKAVSLDRTQTNAASSLALSDQLLAKTSTKSLALPQLDAVYQHLRSQNRTAETEILAAQIAVERQRVWEQAQAALKPLGAQGRVRANERGLLKVDLAQTSIHDLTPLSGLPIASLNLWQTKITNLRPLTGLPLEELFLAYTAVNDLGPLEGMRLQSLTAAYSPVNDLRPLRQMPLMYLYLSGTKTTDLTPLRGMPLRGLHLDRTPVSDLRPLVGLPIRQLRLDGCTQLTDLRPLAQCTELETLILPPKPGDITFLKQLPKLRRLSLVFDLDETKIQTAENFWRTYRRP